MLLTDRVLLRRWLPRIIAGSVAVISGCVAPPAAVVRPLQSQSRCTDVAANVRAATAWHVRLFRQRLDVRVSHIDTGPERDSSRTESSAAATARYHPPDEGVRVGQGPRAFWIAHSLRAVGRDACELRAIVYGEESYRETFLLLPAPPIVGTYPMVFQVTLSQFAER
jgi:hypothetical protein